VVDVVVVVVVLQIQDVVFFVALVTVVAFGTQHSFLIDRMAEKSKRICTQ
jgi:hypothetical protein